ncbi:MAG TPA: HD-GYP domain-containing protein [Candidatus Dormibacteraeota bacterium]|nr:HD-GYP domain-containing protein [Candidatus Dormibacteraeota bacterium]
MAPRRRSELYRLAVALTATGIFLADLPWLVAGRPVEWWLVISLVTAGVVALQFPIHVSLSEKVSVASAVLFVIVLLLPAWQAAAAVAATQAIDVALAASRKVRATRERPPLGTVLQSLLFNAGVGYLSILAAALYLGLAGVSARGEVSNSSVAFAVGAAVIMYALNLLLVSTAVALGTRRSPLTIFFTTHKVVWLQFATLYVLGAAAAYAAIRFPWVLALTVVPAALAYASLKRRIELTRETVRAVEKMAYEVDSRDPYTFQHSQRVASYSKAIGRKLGFSSAEIELVELSAKVHDIGKIRIPDSILLKPGRLTDEERRVMETHPRLGFEILSQFSAYAKVLDLVLSHHERYDGRGYPNSTVGRRLLLIAQVIPVADSLDAMTTARAYRGAKSWEAAMYELRRGAGTQWNPKVVEAALVTLQRDREAAELLLQPAPAVA